MSKQTQPSKFSILRKFLQARTALTETIQKILDLNKSLRRTEKAPDNQVIKKELKLLNKMADQQAKIVQLYEIKLKRASSQ